MSRVCQVTGKAPRSGHHVSHANNKTKRRFLPEPAVPQVLGRGREPLGEDAAHQRGPAPHRQEGPRCRARRDARARREGLSHARKDQARVVRRHRPFLHDHEEQTHACPTRWRSRSTIPSRASTSSTKRPRSSNAPTPTQKKSPALRGFFVLDPRLRGDDARTNRFAPGRASLLLRDDLVLDVVVDGLGDDLLIDAGRSCPCTDGP